MLEPRITESVLCDIFFLQGLFVFYDIFWFFSFFQIYLSIFIWPLASFSPLFSSSTQSHDADEGQPQKLGQPAEFQKRKRNFNTGKLCYSWQYTTSPVSTPGVNIMGSSGGILPLTRIILSAFYRKKIEVIVCYQQYQIILNASQNTEKRLMSQTVRNRAQLSY